MPPRGAWLGLLLAWPLAAQGVVMPGIPDSAGVRRDPIVWAKATNGDWWVGTYGQGIFVNNTVGLATTWRHIASDSTKTSLSMDFVRTIAFAPNGHVWVGTIGNGWSMSSDSGRTWRNWTYSQLGPEWQYVAADGIGIRGDTVAIATADGLQVTTDDGAHWVALVDTVGPLAKGPADTALAVLPSEYLYGAHPQPDGWLLSSLRGGVHLDMHGCLRRAHGDNSARCVTATALDFPRHPDPAGLVPVKGPMTGSAKGWAPWFARPIAEEDNPRIDQTYRWGSTMGGTFQPHQGVEFNNPDGTPVHAIGDGTVVYAGRAERGALVVSIRHDTMLTVGDKRFYVYSVYYHNSRLLTQVGASVKRGDLISQVGHTGRATNDHIHLEVHASPVDSVRLIVDSLNRYPSYVTNPELWITPLPGTGLVAGTVTGADGRLIPQARIYGFNKPLPRETPYVYAETYGERNHPHPLYQENFAISDIPVGTHQLFVIVDGKTIRRTVVVKPGQMTWVEFRP